MGRASACVCACVCVCVCSIRFHFQGLSTGLKWPPPAQWPPLAGGPSPHEPLPSGCPQDRWPRHPASGLSMRTGENQQNRGSQLRHHGLYDGPHCTTPPRGPLPFQWHHPGGPPMPPFPIPSPGTSTPTTHGLRIIAMSSSPNPSLSK